MLMSSSLLTGSSQSKHWNPVAYEAMHEGKQCPFPKYREIEVSLALSEAVQLLGILEGLLSEALMGQFSIKENSVVLLEYKAK